MKRWTLIAMAIAAVGAPTARADSALERTNGTPELGLSGRARAMGGAGSALAQGVFSLVDNPGGLALADASSVDVSLALARQSEIRFVPLFDTFDSFVDDTAIAVNDHHYADLSGGVLWNPGWSLGVVLGAGVFDRYDPRYDYADERRSTSTSDQLIAERFITTRGVLRATSLGAALPVLSRATVGAAVNWYRGDIEHRDALVAHQPGETGTTTELERRLSGLSVTVGGTVRVDERLQAALSLESGSRLDDDYTQLQDGVVISPAASSTRLELPMRLQAGAAYRPRNSHRTTFALDVVWMPWSDAEDGLAPGVQRLDTWDARFGLEHVYYNSLPGRVGFRYSRSYTLRDADRAALTFGVGYRVGTVSLDLGGEVAKRTSRQDPVWPREEQGPAVGAGRDRVEDTTARLTLGVQSAF